MNIEEFKKKAEQLKSVNKKYPQSLKKVNQRKLDDVFHQVHEQVFENVNCLSCANCCKTTSPIFKPRDIENLAKKLKITPSRFIELYLHLDIDNDYVLNVSPCPFLDHENYCLVYNDRPTACREYPHTNRKKMFQLLDLTYKNTMVCPAVLKIVDKLKTSILT